VIYNSHATRTMESPHICFKVLVAFHRVNRPAAQG